MLLSELDIAERLISVDDAKRIVFSPIISADEQIGPSSIDVRLGTDFSVLENLNLSHVSTNQPKTKLKHQIRDYTKEIKIEPDQEFFLHPGEFVLASTLEFLKLPPDIAARIEGRSSWGRLGLLVHATAGFIDPGYCGPLTLELSNSGRLPLGLKPGDRIGQVCFFLMSRPTHIPYGSKKRSKYQGSIGVHASKIADDPEVGN